MKEKFIKWKGKINAICNGEKKREKTYEKWWRYRKYRTYEGSGGRQSQPWPPALSYSFALQANRGLHG
jgi:hypothetical protein